MTDRLVPLRRQFPGKTDVRVMFGQERDAGAPEFPLILAITYPDIGTIEAALTIDARNRSKEVTGHVVAEFLDGRSHHHVMAATEEHEA